MRIALLLAIFIVSIPGRTHASEPEGRRLAYALGCVNCHHQTPREIIDAPPLIIVRAYSMDQFATLLRTGQTSTGRNLPKIGSIMGIVAVEQFSYLEDEEVRQIYQYLNEDWTNEQAAEEEAKIPLLYKLESDTGNR